MNSNVLQNIKVSQFDSNPLYRQVSNKMMELILNGDLKSNQRLPQTEELADILNVSRNTLLKSLNILMKENLIVRRPQKGTFVADLKLRNVDSSHGLYADTVIGIIEERHYTTEKELKNDTFYYQIYQGIKKEFQQNNVSMLILSDAAVNKLHGETKNFRIGIDGIIASGKFDSEIMEQLLNQNIKVVQVNYHNNDKKIDGVVFEQKAGGYKATKHLLSLGHENVCCIYTDLEGNYLERLAGYQKALKEYGKKELIKKINCDDYFQAGEEAVEQILTDSPQTTAFFVVNDLIAAGVVSGIRKRGLKVPEDISVVGFDDLLKNLPGDISLTTIREDPYEMGRVAAQRILSTLNGKVKKARKIILPLKLIIRETTASPRTILKLDKEVL